MPVIVAGALISAAASVGAAKIQSNAAKKAQAAQQAATDKALTVQQQTSKPYTDLGQAAAGRLASTPFQPYTQQFRPGQPNNGVQPTQGGPMPTLGSIGQMGPQGPSPAMPAPQTVNLQAPDGSVRPFPASDAPRIIAQAKAAGHELRQVN